MPVKPALRLLVQHEYISLIHANWRFTIAFGGDRGSGTLGSDPAFSVLSRYVTTQRAEGVKNGDIMQALAVEANLAALWPNWNAVVVLPDLKVGDFVKIRDSEKAIAKKYPGIYGIGQVAKTNAYIITSRAPRVAMMGLAKLWLEKVPKPTT